MSLSVDDLIAQSGVWNIDSECSDVDIRDFADCCDPWRQVGLHLGLTKGQLNAIDEDNRTVSLKRLGVLQKWKEMFVFKATYRVLIEALLKCGKADTALQVCNTLAQRQGGPGDASTRRPIREVQQASSAIEDERTSEADTNNAHVRKRKATEENKPRRVQADLSEEKPLNAAHPPSNIDGHGPSSSKLMVVIWVLLIVGGICAVGWGVYTLSSVSHNNPAYAHGVDRSDRESEPTTRAGTKKTDSSMDARSKESDDIKNFIDLIQAVKEIGDWQSLCINLGVGQEVIDPLVHSTDTVDAKKSKCLRAYINGGEAKWSGVVKAVDMHPINNKRVAKAIAADHEVNF